MSRFGEQWRDLQAWAESDREKNRAQMRQAWGEFQGDMAKIGMEYKEIQTEARGRKVTRTRIGAGTHSIHATLTVCTCGAWLPVWIVHALLKRGKTTTR